MKPIARRALLGGLAVAPLAGCGFQPVYMRTASGKPGPAQRELAAINVLLIPDRPGQLLRQALQQRLYGTDDTVARRYDLGVFFWITGEGIAVLPDTTSAATRMIGHASWTLVARDTARTHVANGTARAFDTTDAFDTQYFANALQNEQATRRIADQLADEITLRLATLFRSRAG